MGGSVNEPNLAKEWQYPGMQARQPLAKGNNQQDSLSSTESLQGDFFGEGGLSSALKQALGTDTIPGFDNSGMFGGGGSSNTGGGSSPFTALPNTAIGGNAPTLPNMAVTGGSEYDGWGNYVGGDSGSSSNYTNSGMGGASNSNNFLSEWASSIDLGGSYNPSFFNEPAGLGSSDYFSSNSLFNFGNQALGSNIPGIGDFAKANSIANRFGYGNENVNNAMGVLGLTGNKLFDYAADATGNDYLGMLNDDFSQRGIVNKSLRMGGVPYSSAIMAGLDYQQGVTDWGNIASTAGGMLLGPAGALAGYLGGNYFGGKDYNDNWVGPSDEWASANGYTKGTELYDQAVNNYRDRDRLGKLTESQSFFKEDWQNDKFDPSYLEQNMLGGSTINDPKSVFVAPETLQEAIEYKEKFGQQGDESWTPGDGKTYHSDKFNWNGMEQNRAETAGEKANELIRVEENRVQAEKVAAAERAAAAQRAEAAARVAEQQRVAQAQAQAKAQAEAQAKAEAQAQAQAQQERAAMEASNSFSSSDSGSFDSGGNYSAWGSQESFEDDQGDSSWW